MILQLGQWVVSLAVFVLVLWVVVMVHELGHFVTGRLANIRVLEFGLGYPPRAKLLGQDHETKYTLNWIPIGGFCLFEGEESDSQDGRSFSQAGLPRQVIVLAAGAAMNVVLAFVLFFFVAWLANPIVGAKIGSVEAASPAQRAGLVSGDAIVAVDGQQYGWMANAGVLDAIHGRAGQTATIEIVAADGAHRTVTVQLRSQAEIDALSKSDGQQHGVLGIQTTRGSPPISYVQNDPVTAAGSAASQTVGALGLILGSLRDLGASIVSNPTAAPPASGPIGIADQVHSSLFDLGPIFVILLAALLSANLALVNILPFPPLDGGKIVVMAVKRMVGSRKVSGFEQATYLVGFVLLIGFVVWISFFDVLRGVSGP